MDTQNRAFLDLLPAPFATLDNWHMQPPFPLLVSGRFRVTLPESEYEQFVEAMADGLQTFDQYDFDEMFIIATKCYAIYCQITDRGAAESDIMRKDFARLTYQLCLNFRDAIEHLDLHDDDEADYGFHFGVDIKHYNDPE